MKQNNAEKLSSDKAFFRMITTSAISVIICLICLCSTSWAWFSGGIESSQNEIKTGQCLLEVTVEKEGVALSEIETGVALEMGTEYKVTLALPKGSASGYCLMQANGKDYYSKAILRHEEEQAKTLSFTVKVKENTTVKFIARWGIYSGEVDVANGGILEI